MRIKSFDRKKYNKMMETLEKRKAPNYIFEAYHEGHIDVINLYYREKINKKLGKPSVITENTGINYIDLALLDKRRRFIQEAVSKKDLDFLKIFYQLTGMDILSGKKLPPNPGKLLMQQPTKNLKLTDIFNRQKEKK